MVGVLTSLSRLYLISYLRMSPLGFRGSSQRSRTLFLPAGSHVTLPGMLSACTGEGHRGGQLPGASPTPRPTANPPPQWLQDPRVSQHRRGGVRELGWPARRTLGHGPGEDEGGSAAAHGVRGMVAGVDVDAVLGEMPQPRQHHPVTHHLVLEDLEIRFRLGPGVARGRRLRRGGVGRGCDGHHIPAPLWGPAGDGDGGRWAARTPEVSPKIKQGTGDPPGLHGPRSPLWVLVDGCHLPGWPETVGNWLKDLPGAASRPPSQRRPPHSAWGTSPPTRRPHLGMMMELWRKFSNFFWKDSASPPMRSCPSAGRQGQQRSSASCSTSGPSPSPKRVSALLVGSFSPAGRRRSPAGRERPHPRGVRRPPRPPSPAQPTFVAVVVDVELHVLGQLLPQHQVVGDVAVALRGRLPTHHDVGGGVGHGDDVPGHRRGWVDAGWGVSVHLWGGGHHRHPLVPSSSPLPAGMVRI